MSHDDAPGIEAVRHAALGRLARHIAHDFNNTLHLVQGALDCLESLVERGEPIEQAAPFVASMRRAVLRGRQRVGELQPLLRAEPGRRSMGEVLERIVPAIQHIRPALRLGLDVAEPCTSVDVDEAVLAELALSVLSSAESATLRTRLEPDHDATRLVLELTATPPPPTTPLAWLEALAAHAGATLERADTTLALAWPTRGITLLGEVLVLVVGDDARQRAAVARACSDAGWAPLVAAVTELEDVLEDYGDELEAAVLWPARPGGLSGLQASLEAHLASATGTPPLVTRSAGTRPEDVPRLVCDALWRVRLTAITRRREGGADP